MPPAQEKSTPSSLPNLLAPGQFASIQAIELELSIELLSCRLWRMTRSSVRDRQLPDWLMIVPVSGRLSCRVGETRREIGPGELMLAPKWAVHDILPAADPHAGDSEAYSLHALFIDNPAQPSLDLAASPFMQVADAAGFHRRLALLTHAMGRDAETGRAMGARLLRDLLVEQVLAGAPLRPGFTAMDPRMTRVLSHIRRHPTAPLTVEELARRAELSVSRFRVVFREATGESPKRYLLKHRLGQARELLVRQPDLTIQQVAERTGFNDAHYLHQVFRQSVGQTPDQFRRQMQASAEQAH